MVLCVTLAICHTIVTNLVGEPILATSIYEGNVPKDFKKVRNLFEVHFDGCNGGVDAVVADVYFDGLYFGD